MPTPPSPDKKSSTLELLHSEVDINLEEQKLIKKRMAEIEGYLKEISSEDPEYALYEAQVLADRVYMDELILEEESLRTLIEQKSSDQ